MLRIHGPRHVAVLVLRVSLSFDACACVPHSRCCLQRVRRAHALCGAGCKRSGLTPSRCAQERRSNAHPLSRHGCTHAVHEAACSEHAIVLVCGANSSHAYRTCRASCGGGIVIAVSRSSAHGGHAGIVSSVGGRASMLFGGRNWSSLRPPRRRSRGLRLGGCSVGTLCWSALDLDGRCRAHRVHRSAHRARVSIDGISDPFV